MEKEQTNKIKLEEYNSNKSITDNRQISNITRICENAKRIIDKNEQILYESQQKIKLISINACENEKNKNTHLEIEKKIISEYEKKNKINSFDSVKLELKELNIKYILLEEKYNLLREKYNLGKE